MSRKSKALKYRTRNKRITTVWLVADPHTPESVIDEVIEIVRRARREASERQRQQGKREASQ